jgi:hypothetical protein
VLVVAALTVVVAWGRRGAVAAGPPAAVAPIAGDVGPSFRQDIIPLLTRYGCNSGGCHGKLSGQNGFRLSLRGYAPEWDYDWLVKEVNGRRVDFARPEASLIVLKGTGQVAHEGGRRFDKDSRAAKVMTEWVANRAPGPDATEADAVRLEVAPGGGTVKVGETRQLSVKAHWPDGRSADVTWLAQFFSNDETTVSVSENGLVKSLRHGEAGVRVHFQGLVEVLLFTMPHPAAVEGSQYAAKQSAVDEHVFAKLAALRIPVSPPSDDAAFVRRAFLDAIGTMPTPDEVRAFVADPRPDKRARLVDDLLARPEWVDFWTMNLCDLLQNRKERDHDVRGAKGVRSFQAWVRGQLAANRPWDQIARDVILATGDSQARPEVGYYITTIGEKTNVAESEVAESVAQSFLGTRIGCAKCHNHPLEKFTQDDYYRFVAFFSRVQMKRVDSDKGVTTLTIQSREEAEVRKEIERTEKALAEAEKARAAEKPPEKKDDKATPAQKKIAEQKKRVEELNKRLADARAKPPTVTQPRTKKAMAAMALDRREQTFQPGHDPREPLAAWITDPSNEAFSGSMVNRVWRHFMGVGLVEQVDDLRSSNPPSNPALWKALNAHFVAERFDLKALMRLVMTSRAYQLSSATLPGNEQDQKFYSHYYARRLPAEVFSDAIAAATGVPDSFPGYPAGVRAVQLPEPGVNSYFLTIFGRSDRVTACACEKSGDVTLPQLLYLNNGEELKNKLRSGDGRLAAVLKRKGNDAQTTEDLFLATVCRRPTEAEAKAVTDALAAGDPRDEVFRDLFWALLNSKEFAFNH